jgi:hypothetical protein
LASQRGARRRKKVAGDSDAMSQAITFAIGPALFGVLGRMADAALGVTPLLTVLGVVLGFAGGAATLYYRYEARMQTLEADKPWRRLASSARKKAAA